MKTYKITILDFAGEVETLSDLFGPDDVPEGEIWVRRGLVKTFTGDRLDAVIAYQQAAGLQLRVVARNRQTHEWELHKGILTREVTPLQAAISLLTGEPSP
jgi:hypothetical protein